MEKGKLLLVEDDTTLGYLLSEYLGMKGFLVNWGKNGEEALSVIKNQTFDLVIMDIMMPKMDGFTLAQKLKEEYPSLPFLFLTSRSLKIDVLKGFSLGAVDYLKKPIDEEELVVRIETLLSRLKEKSPQPEKNSTLQIGKYNLNTETQELNYDGKAIQLTGREFELLVYLTENMNRLCTHKDILMTLWGKNDYFNRKSLNVFVSHLRKYLSKDTDLKIENIHNQGFLLKINKEKGA